MRNIFLETLYSKCGRETIPRPFPKTQYWAHLWSIIYTSYKIFLKNRKRSGISLCLIFCMIFEENFSSCYTLLTDQISLTGCLYFVRCLAICILYFFNNQAVTSSIFKLSLSFEWSRFFYMTKKSKQKFKNLETEKSFLDEIKIIFHHF